MRAAERRKPEVQMILLKVKMTNYIFLTQNPTIEKICFFFIFDSFRMERDFFVSIIMFDTRKNRISNWMRKAAHTPRYDVAFSGALFWAMNRYSVYSTLSWFSVNQRKIIRRRWKQQATTLFSRPHRKITSSMYIFGCFVCIFFLFSALVLRSLQHQRSVTKKNICSRIHFGVSIRNKWINEQRK